MIVYVLFCVVLSLIILQLLRAYDERNRKFEEIPGPKGIPIFGNIQDIFYRPEELWRRTRSRALEYFPIYKIRLLNKKIVNLVDPIDIEAILGNSRYIDKGSMYAISTIWLGEGIIMATGDRWKKSRKLFTKCFHYGALQNYIESFNNGVAYLSSSLEGHTGKPLDLSSFLSNHSCRLACENLFGLVPDIEGLKSIVKALENLCTISFYKLMIPLVHSLYHFTWLKTKESEALKVFSDYKTQAVENHGSAETENKEDFKVLNVLLKNYDEQGIQDEINNLLFAAQDTTSTALYFIMYVLGCHPHSQDEIYKEMMQIPEKENPTYGDINQMNFLDRFIKECLRMYPPVYFIGRSLKEDVQTPSGYTIPAETWIFLNIFDVHRNPNIYPNPDVFDPDRFLPENSRGRHPYSFIPFSGGHRNCIAQKFAMLEIKTTIVGMLKKYKIEAVGSLEDVELVPEILLETKSPLRVKLIPRNSK